MDIANIEAIITPIAFAGVAYYMKTLWTEIKENRKIVDANTDKIEALKLKLATDYRTKQESDLVVGDFIKRLDRIEYYFIF